MPTVVKNIDQITINGSNKYLNGYIYNIDYTPGFGASASTLKVSIVNETGEYLSPNLSVLIPNIIKIGRNLTLKMYPIKYSEKKSTEGGKLLQVEFVDGSFLLDKIYIGLNQRHGSIAEVERDGAKFSEKFSVNKNLIIVGRLLHPCDSDKNGALTFDEVSNLDPCDPCPNCPADKYKSRCDELASARVFDVAYSFKDLITAVNGSNKGIKIETPNGIGESSLNSYLKEYVGTLRDVLDQWSSEFGLSHYYDPEQNQIFFKDLTSDIDINKDFIVGNLNSDTNVKIISQDEEVSIENTTTRGAISHYQRDGEKKSYTCQKTDIISLPAITDFDLYGESKRTVFCARKEKALKLDLNSFYDTVGTILGAYSPYLREAYWLRWIYGITDCKNAAAMKQKFQLGKGAKNQETGIFLNGNDKNMPELGNFAIIEVISGYKGTNAEFDAELQAAIKANNTEKANNLRAQKQYRKLLNGISSEQDRDLFEKKGGYFIVAYRDEDAQAKILEEEKLRFDSIGRFYLREGVLRMCSIPGDEEFVKTNTQIDSPDGQGTVLSRKETISTSPLHKYKFKDNSYVGCVLGSTVAPPTTEIPKDFNPASPKGSVTIKGYKFDFVNGAPILTKTPASYQKFDKIGFSPNNLSESLPNLESSAIIVEREPKFFPTLDEVSAFEPVLNTYQDYGLALYGSDGKPDVGNTVYEFLGIDKSVKLKESENALLGKTRVYAIVPGIFNLTYEEAAHPTDKSIDKLDKKVQQEQEKVIEGKNVNLGLLDDTCLKLKVDNFLNIYCPPNSVPIGPPEKNEYENPEDPCDDFLKDRKPTYKVAISQNFNKEIYVPKAVFTINDSTIDPLKENTMKFDLNYYNITDEDFKVFTGGRNGCQVDYGRIQAVHDRFNKALTFNQTKPQRKISFMLKGIPTFANTIREELDLGLESLNVNITNNGTETNISYSNSFAKTESLDVIKNKTMYNSSQMSKSKKSVI